MPLSKIPITTSVEFIRRKLNDVIDAVNTGGGGSGSSSWGGITGTLSAQTDLQSALNTKASTAAVSGKQATLVSGTNIKTINGTSLLGSGNVDAEQQSFETVSKNLRNYPATLAYTNGVLTAVSYNTGSGTITKTLNYTSGVLTSIVLSGATPSGISLTKALSYTGSTLTGLTYS